MVAGGDGFWASFGDFAGSRLENATSLALASSSLSAKGLKALGDVGEVLPDMVGLACGAAGFAPYRSEKSIVERIAREHC